MEKFVAMEKYDDRTGDVYGCMTAAERDKGDEFFDYDGGGKADVQRWSNECVASTRAAGQEISLGNIRLQHDASKIAGKAIRIDYDDNRKTIGLLSRPVNEEMRDLVRQGFVRGYSIAGDYQSRTCDECGADMMSQGNDCPHCGRRVLVRFVPRIVECSYVDNPCVESATFEFVRADGSSMFKSFKEGSMKEHFRKAAKHHERAAKCHKALAGHHAGLAKACESRADFASAKLHKAISDEHAAIARNHEQHAEHLSTVADHAPNDVWPLAGWTVDSEGEAIGGPGSKVAKADDFFSRYLYGGRSPEETLAQLPSSGDLFR